MNATISPVGIQFVLGYIRAHWRFFSKRYALYKSTFYLLNYLFTKFPVAMLKSWLIDGDWLTHSYLFNIMVRG